MHIFVAVSRVNPVAHEQVGQLTSFAPGHTACTHVPPCMVYPVAQVQLGGVPTWWAPVQEAGTATHEAPESWKPALHEQVPLLFAVPLAGALVWVPAMLEQTSVATATHVAPCRVKPVLHEQVPPEAVPFVGALVWVPGMLEQTSVLEAGLTVTVVLSSGVMVPLVSKHTNV